MLRNATAVLAERGVQAAADRTVLAGRPQAERAQMLVPYVCCAAYDLVLSAIDDGSDPHGSAVHVQHVVTDLGLEHRVIHLNRDFRGAAHEITSRHGDIDLLWFDAGGAPECIDPLREFWPVARPGRIVALHGAYWTVPVTVQDETSELPVAMTIPAAIANKIRRQHGQAGEDFPFGVMSLVEVHKWRQNSVLLLRELALFERLRPAGLLYDLDIPLQHAQTFDVITEQATANRFGRVCSSHGDHPDRA